MIEVATKQGIVAAACRLGELTFTIPPPARHHDVLRAMMARGLPDYEADQGFLDHRGVYLNRKTAMITAVQCGQVERDISGAIPELFSEDLW
jgi:hypothetical protein